LVKKWIYNGKMVMKDEKKQHNVHAAIRNDRGIIFSAYRIGPHGQAVKYTQVDKNSPSQKASIWKAALCVKLGQYTVYSG
jgi:hypothetical protein